MEKVGNEISGYSYGEAEVGRSSVTVQQLDELKVSCGFEREDQYYLQLAGAVLADQTKEIVDHWRSGIIAGIPHLARHSRTLEGEAIPAYLAKSESPLPAMDYRHLSSALRSGLDRLPAGNRVAAYVGEEEHGRWSAVNSARAAA